MALPGVPRRKNRSVSCIWLNAPMTLTAAITVVSST